MSSTNPRNDLDTDNKLAEFTDQILEGKMNQTASSKQMLVRLKARMRREEKEVKPSFWQRLFDVQSNPQVGMILAAVAVLVLAVIAVPMFTSTSGTSVTGTASSPGLPIAAGVIVLLLLALLWFGRKK